MIQVGDVSSFSLPLLEQVTILVVVAIASIFLIVLVPKGWLFTGRKRDRNENGGGDLYTVQKCPNPDCIRCRRYTEVNRSAQKRLPWVIRDLLQQQQTQRQQHCGDTDNQLQRVQEAVRLGPSNQQHQNKRHNNGTKEDMSPTVSPTDGQYPTVLLVPGLLAEPIVTQLHNNICEIFEGTKGNNTRQMILEEYLLSHQGSRHSQNDVTENQSNRNNDDGNNNSTANASINKKKDHNTEEREPRRGQWLENDVQGDFGKWEVLHLLNQGEWIYENMNQCPKTTEFVQTQLSGSIIPEGCIFGNVFISVLEPGTTIERHCGPTNVRHRLHFALQIPSTGTTTVATTTGHSSIPRLTVLDQTLTWTEGQCFVFDDSLVHAVDYPVRANISGRHKDYLCKTQCEDVRAVLIIDLWHPELSILERQAIVDLYSTSGRQR